MSSLGRLRVAALLLMVTGLASISVTLPATDGSVLGAPKRAAAPKRGSWQPWWGAAYKVRSISLDVDDRGTKARVTINAQTRQCPETPIIATGTVPVSADGKLTGHLKSGVVGHGVHVGKPKVSGRFAADGRTFKGIVRQRFRSDYDAYDCTPKVKFVARFKHSDVLNPGDAGTYTGTTSQGHSVSFSVKFDPNTGTAIVSDLAFDIDMTCNDGTTTRTFLEHAGGISAATNQHGEFSSQPAAGANPQSSADGKRQSEGEWHGNVYMDGSFEADGTPTADPNAPPHPGQAYCAEMASFTAKRG
jgi:hypothetical protein